jgi:hypothetical protein
MLVVFVDQVHKKNETLYPLKCMTNIFELLFVTLCLYVTCNFYVYGQHLGGTFNVKFEIYAHQMTIFKGGVK